MLSHPRSAVLLVVLALAWVPTASADPVLVRGGSTGVMQVETVEDLVGVIGRGFPLLTPAEADAWNQRRRADEQVSAGIARKAERRGVVYFVGIMVVIYIFLIYKLVKWLRRRRPKPANDRQYSL